MDADLILPGTKEWLLFPSDEGIDHELTVPCEQAELKNIPKKGTNNKNQLLILLTLTMLLVHYTLTPLPSSKEVESSDVTFLSKENSSPSLAHFAYATKRSSEKEYWSKENLKLAFKGKVEELLLSCVLKRISTNVRVDVIDKVGTVASIAASPSSLLPSTVGILQYQDRRVILMLYTGKRQKEMEVSCFVVRSSLLERFHPMVVPMRSFPISLRDRPLSLKALARKDSLRIYPTQGPESEEKAIAKVLVYAQESLILILRSFPPSSLLEEAAASDYLPSIKNPGKRPINPASNEDV
ncbi:E3 ubiquitin-protein ligase synoviolin [Striga asiatica]|uniref:E3 ubiquitin-protein ligase synoviolin n=1 Tax=Striga asiatica TaxID=4170 RepID=A0A5A7QWW0_STRAF|nr:E3 ubiquitin-protein ligase synoviolin [Striga asiatica]